MKNIFAATALCMLLVVPASAQQKMATLPDGKMVYISKAPGDTASIGTYYNRNVYNTAGEKLGDVNDLLLAPDRTISTAVIRVGGFLGIGEKEVAVPFDSLKVVLKDNTWFLEMVATKDSLKAAPAFEQSTDRVRFPATPPQTSPALPPKQ